MNLYEHRVKIFSGAYLRWQLLFNGHWDWEWQREETKLLVEVILEH